MLDSLKNKLGFGTQQNYNDRYYDDEQYASGYHANDYEDYGDYTDDQQAQEYDRYDTVTTRAAESSRSRRGSYLDHTTGTGNRPGNGARASLINYDEVRASTRVPESLNRDPLPPRRRSGIGREAPLRASDYKLSGSDNADTALPTLNAPVSNDRSTGYNALFDSSSDVQASSSQSAVGTAAAGHVSAYDPYKAYEGAGSTKHAPTRRVTVIAPAQYSEVEGVSRSLKAGDAVVLNLHNTGNQLSKRVLDFSFGVASALDATVDCIADQVFAITRITPLTDAELTDLRAKGAL